MKGPLHLIEKDLDTHALAQLMADDIAHGLSRLLERHARFEDFLRGRDAAEPDATPTP